jgi:hypothetical protein
MLLIILDGEILGNTRLLLIKESLLIGKIAYKGKVMQSISGDHEVDALYVYWTAATYGNMAILIIAMVFFLGIGAFVVYFNLRGL